jgi:hypothetical protein
MMNNFLRMLLYVTTDITTNGIAMPNNANRNRRQMCTQSRLVSRYTEEPHYPCNALAVEPYLHHPI